MFPMAPSYVMVKQYKPHRLSSSRTLPVKPFDSHVAVSVSLSLFISYKSRVSTAVLTHDIDIIVILYVHSQNKKQDK